MGEKDAPAVYQNFPHIDKIHVQLDAVGVQQPLNVLLLHVVLAENRLKIRV